MLAVYRHNIVEPGAFGGLPGVAAAVSLNLLGAAAAFAVVDIPGVATFGAAIAAAVLALVLNLCAPDIWRLGLSGAKWWEDKAPWNIVPRVPSIIGLWFAPMIALLVVGLGAPDLVDLGAPFRAAILPGLALGGVLFVLAPSLRQIALLPIALGMGFTFAAGALSTANRVFDHSQPVSIRGHIVEKWSQAYRTRRGRGVSYNIVVALPAPRAGERHHFFLFEGDYIAAYPGRPVCLIEQAGALGWRTRYVSDCP